MKYRIGVCDDETLQVKVNMLYINEIAKKNHIDVEVKGMTKVETLYKFMDENRFDLIFLDIDMGEVSGLEAAERIMAKYPDTEIVFLTGHREFANEAFDVEAAGYIVKPIDEKKLERVLMKSMKHIMAQNMTESQASLVVNVENLKNKINQSDIIYIERSGPKSVIYTGTKEYSVYETLTALYERLAENKFIRISQSFVINKDFIKEIKGGIVYMKNGGEFVIGRTYKKEVNKKYFLE